ncbi:MAG: sigma-70 family RNA polymerase sigma factor [Acidobacteria bacterium]|nr:sigma-70 family RNA polymerase sigma factor [Acidobacteriota bacterium]
MGKIRDKNLPDEVLVVGAILGDLQSFDTLVMRYRSAAYRVAQSVAGTELAEDAVQEALLLAYKALPSIEEPSKFAAWLYAITRHVALRMSQRTRQEISKRVELDEALLEHSNALARPLAPNDAPIDMFDTGWVRAAIDSLDEDYRLILKLRYYDEMPLKRISGFLDLPLSTVKWRLYRAKQMLREQLKPENEGLRRRVKIKN